MLCCALQSSSTINASTRGIHVSPEIDKFASNPDETLNGGQLQCCSPGLEGRFLINIGSGLEKGINKLKISFFDCKLQGCSSTVGGRWAVDICTSFQEKHHKVKPFFLNGNI
ncbi:uncharacterized protein N7473_006628 [Penicillium subrubescens]|uniref:Uncharacterized protein n=1 Tax=Penicillium subrubescens TaxID=1316194 RepID=A0A1Q5SW97_9EURO|nr:uncharacterized protein N7473_006628 [Penicillium subrubescens]KAJ5890400.1 hypothetical protein N7473_006628 [Penicillium subrubescens]OKO92288.1 hypothetical protein PENSUB_12850 [Penicillium subrubescens]